MSAFSLFPFTFHLFSLLLLLCFFPGCGRHDSARHAAGVSAATRPAIAITPGKIRPPLPYRIVSFHRGRADKELIRLAHDLGFNGVQFQIEWSTVSGVKEFARRDAEEHLVDYCHSLGMQVTLWVHELNEIPREWMPEYLGPVDAGNDKLFALLDDRYEWMLRDAVPNVDGLVLTVVETEIRATDTDFLAKLVALLRQKTDKYRKSLIFRTFVWYPDELQSTMAAIDKFPADQLVMSKCTPQDWNTRGISAAEIGHVGSRPQIIEYDVAGEYFLRNTVANCMPELLKKHFDYGIQNNVSGICVRVDRDDASVLNQPSEVNLWTLGMLATGASDNLDEIWNAWAANRYGPSAASGVITALKPTGGVVSEMLSVGPFSFSDPRWPLPLADEDVFGDLWQNWWWDKSYLPARDAAEDGDPAFTAQVAADKAAARLQADRCLWNLELVKDKLSPEDYQILKTRLLSNQVQLAFRSAMIMATLHYRRLASAPDQGARDAANEAMRQDLEQLRQVIRPQYPPAQELKYLGTTFAVGSPDIPREWLYKWAYKMDQLRQGQDPRAGRWTKRWYK